jgi:quinol monooxygenase YgiN
MARLAAAPAITARVVAAARLAAIGGLAGERTVSETYVITFHLRPGQRERFRALLDPVLDAMRHETTFVHAALHADPDDDHRYQLHETWTDRDDVLNVQLSRPYRAAWHAALEDMLDRPREIAVWRLLRADP